MKTTLAISDSTMRAIKREAARRRVTMSELVEAAIRRLLKEKERAPELPDLPEFETGGARINVANRDALYEAMKD
jgi:hypothetical protein